MNLNQQQKIALKIVNKLRQSGYIAYYAGGCVRDLVMRRSAEDIDITSDAPPGAVERLFKKSIPVGKQFGVVIVLDSGYQFEIATFRSETGYLDGRHPTKVSFTTAEEDAKRRDFTINGLFYDPVKRQVIDYVGGREDIKRKLIRTIGRAQERFEEDHLRILRAIRFAANLNFKIDTATWKAIHQFRKKIHLVSHERIRDELVKMFTRPGAGRGLELLSLSGILDEILPEIEAMKGVKQPKEFHPEGDVFVHTKMLMDRLKNPPVALAFGALLHDVGKPPTFAKEKRAIHFYNHAFIGAQMARKMLARLRFSNRDTDEIVSCVENHMKFGDVKKMRIGKLKQFVARPNFSIELELNRIDCMSSHRKFDVYRFLKQKLKEFQKEEMKPKRIMNGYDLIEFGIQPGPMMKEILEELYTLQLEGKFRSREGGFEWLETHYQQAKMDSKKKRSLS